jgi:hypothetical protein
VNARRIEGRDDRPKLQIRVDLGVLQMELEGRPDGETPGGHPSLLEMQSERLERYVEQNRSSQGFVLSSEECRALREEAVQYYHRYVGLFVLGDFAAVVRDTTRNLEVFDLCRTYGQTEADRAILEQFRPHVIMMRVRAAAEIALGQNRPKDALAELDDGLEMIRAFYEDAGMPDAFADANEVQLLRGMRASLVPKLPASQRAELRERLQVALATENYELAAILRDELRMLGD